MQQCNWYCIWMHDPYVILCFCVCGSDWGVFPCIETEEEIMIETIVVFSTLCIREKQD